MHDDESLEKAARRAASLFVDIYRGLDERRVVPDVTADQLDRALDGTADCDEGVGLLAALDEVEETILPATMGTPCPTYLGLVNSSPLPGAALADLLVSALNNNAGAAHQSPSMSACERQVCRAFSRRFGMPESTVGLVLPGGTFANLQGIVLARYRCTGGPALAQLRMYTSSAAHFSVSRAAMVAGLAPHNIVSIDTNGRGAMDVDALAEHVARDRQSGAMPFCLVATAGTTATGAIDPLAEIADVCAEQNMWLHVDGCYGGAAALLGSHRARFAGIERADSLAIDPHKWFFIPITAALLLSPHLDLARTVFEASHSSYIPDDGAVPDAWKRGIPTSRRASGFAVWMALRAHGWRAILDAVASNIALTRRLEQRLAEAGFEVLPHGELSIACARWQPPGLDPESTDALQTRIAETVIATGRAWFSTARHAGRTWLRFNLVNLHTREHHIDQVAELVIEAARSAEMS